MPRGIFPAHRVPGYVPAGGEVETSTFNNNTWDDALALGASDKNGLLLVCANNDVYVNLNRGSTAPTGTDDSFLVPADTCLWFEVQAGNHVWVRRATGNNTTVTQALYPEAI